MLIRLGRVLYWTATALAALVAAFGVLIALTPDTPTSAALAMIMTAGALFLAGIAARYVIAGETIAADFRRSEGRGRQYAQERGAEPPHVALGFRCDRLT